MTYHQTVVGLVWDFDRTLSPGSQYEHLLEEYGIDQNYFETQTNRLIAKHSRRGMRIARSQAVLAQILAYAERGLMPDLTEGRLRELGEGIAMSVGLPEVLVDLRMAVGADPTLRGVTIEHYVVSTGLGPLIRGSRIGPHIDGMWANEFFYRSDLHGADEAGHAAIAHQARCVDPSSQSRAIFEINKGSIRDGHVDVNDLMSDDQRRIPIRNMIYVSGNPDSVPMFSIVNANGGMTLGVAPRVTAEDSMRKLAAEGRVHAVVPSDFRPGSEAAEWLRGAVIRIASDMTGRAAAMSAKTSRV